MSNKKIVLKFGGSVLKDENDLAKAVSEIYRYYRKGYKVLAVVSAFYGATDKLILSAKKVNDDDVCSRSLATLLATGEAATSSLLCIALKRSGINSISLSPSQLGLITKGDGINDEISSVNITKLERALDEAVVIVSGFVGVNEEGDYTLLGRGGSDLTALYLANALNAECKLIKDVSGLFDRDPARYADAKIFERASYETVISFGGELVQPKAVRFAQSNHQTFDIASLASKDSTKIGDHFDVLGELTKRASPIRVALLGCGVVGGGVYKRLSQESDKFIVTGVVNLNRDKAVAAGIPEELIADDPIELIENNCDVVIELIGGSESALDYINLAIKNGKHIVSANKALFAKHGGALNDIADLYDVELRYNAAVGGVVPILETIANIEDIVSVKGVLNGTCNFICGELSKGIGFDDAVKLAQKAGYAEADPTLDIDGTDAAQKLILIIKAAFDINITLDQVERTGIDALDVNTVSESLKKGFATRLIAECVKDGSGIKARVFPVQIPTNEQFAKLNGADNCVEIKNAAGAITTIKGKGAGRWATTEAVLADLFDLERTKERNYITDPTTIKYLEVAA